MFVCTDCLRLITFPGVSVDTMKISRTIYIACISLSFRQSAVHKTAAEYIARSWHKMYSLPKTEANRLLFAGVIFSYFVPSVWTTRYGEYAIETLL